MNRKMKNLFTSKFFYLAVLLLAAFIAGRIFMAERRLAGGLVTFEVKRQNMTISVIEGGSLVALQSRRIINTVPGNRTVLEAIEDGTSITEEDIENGLVLIRLDSSDLEDRLERLKLDVENSRASFMEAEQRLEMQVKQNESDITQAELKVKFSEMDLKKYLGHELAVEVLEAGDADFDYLLESEKLGGQALSRRSQLNNNIDIAREQLTRAIDRAEWSRRLAERGYITQSEFEADLLSVRQREVDLERAELEYGLFLDYDFTKDVEKHMSDYVESLRELERVRANCRARLIQAESSLQSRKRTYELNLESLADVEQQIRRCTIRAEHVGFVTTPSTGHRWWKQEPIQPGTVVRLNQELFHLPDFRSMGVEVNIHEAAVRRIERGQKAVVRVDAFQEERFTGQVRRIAHMPDQTLQFLNPDLNVYVTTVSLDNTNPHLRPGMASRVEIIIDELKDVIAVPIDAVLFRGDAAYCVVSEGNRVYERRVELGAASDTMVEVDSGLKEGETVVMQPRMAASRVREMELEETGRFEEPPAEEPPGMEIPTQPPAGGQQGGGRQRR